MEITTVIELIGIVAFAITGVFVGIEYELDIFGILVVAFCSALAGGIMRDLVVDRVPPMCFTHPEYIFTVIIAVLVALIIFKVLDKRLTKNSIKKMRRLVDILDAIGLGFFAVSGCKIAIEQGYGDNFGLMVFVGTISAIGGGVIRDLLAGRKPIVMRKEVYALAAITGSVIFYFLQSRVHQNIALYVSAGFITIFRIIASWSRINIAYNLKNADMKNNG